jgi:hypothetical protein
MDIREFVVWSEANSLEKRVMLIGVLQAQHTLESGPTSSLLPQKSQTICQVQIPLDTIICWFSVSVSPITHLFTVELHKSQGPKTTSHPPNNTDFPRDSNTCRLPPLHLVPASHVRGQWSRWSATHDRPPGAQLVSVS